MLFAIAFMEGPTGLRALAPDLPACDLTGQTEQELLPRLRLAIEGTLTELLLARKPLPETREGQPAPAARASLPTARWLTIHINVAHLAALAAHQARLAAG